MINLSGKDWDDRDPLEQAAFLLRLEKAKVFIAMDNLSEAEKELYEALKLALRTAEIGEKNSKKELFIESISRFRRLIPLLQEYRFMEDAWAEIYVVAAVCYKQVGIDDEAKKAFRKAIELEPDNKGIQDIGRRHGWINEI